MNGAWRCAASGPRDPRQPFHQRRQPRARAIGFKAGGVGDFVDYVVEAVGERLSRSAVARLTSTIGRRCGQGALTPR
jgi:hypothetical protein